MTYDRAKAERLVAEALEDDLRLPVGPWEVWTSNSFRRVTGPDGKDGAVLSAQVQRDGFPDLSMSEDNLERLARTRNNLRALAEQLRLAGERIAELEAGLKEACDIGERCHSPECEWGANCRWNYSERVSKLRLLGSATTKEE